MIKSIVLALFGLGLIYLALIKSENVHWPLLAIMLTAIGVGFVNPTKGWIVVIVLTLILIIFGFAFESFSIETVNNKIVRFLCYISFLPALFGGFMGKYFSKIFKN